MSRSNKEIAEEYYRLYGSKDAEGIKKYLHTDVELISPLASVKGKDKVCEATRNFIHTIKSLRIRSKFSSEDQAMIVYDTEIPGVSNSFPGASLLNFKDGYIVRIELFFDSRLVVQKKDEIYR